MYANRSFTKPYGRGLRGSVPRKLKKTVHKLKIVSGAFFIDFDPEILTRDIVLTRCQLITE